MNHYLQKMSDQMWVCKDKAQADCAMEEPPVSMVASKNDAIHEKHKRQFLDWALKALQRAVQEKMKSVQVICYFVDKVREKLYPDGKTLIGDWIGEQCQYDEAVMEKVQIEWWKYKASCKAHITEESQDEKHNAEDATSDEHLNSAKGDIAADVLRDKVKSLRNILELKTVDEIVSGIKEKVVYLAQDERVAIICDVFVPALGDAQIKDHGHQHNLFAAIVELSVTGFIGGYTIKTIESDLREKAHSVDSSMEDLRHFHDINIAIQHDKSSPDSWKCVLFRFLDHMKSEGVNLEEPSKFLDEERKSASEVSEQGYDSETDKVDHEFYKDVLRKLSKVKDPDLAEHCRELWEELGEELGIAKDRDEFWKLNE